MESGESESRNCPEYHNRDAEPSAPPSSPTRGSKSKGNSLPISSNEEGLGSSSPSANKSSPQPGSSPPKKASSVKIQKQYSKIIRFRTKILQNLGKADKTTDEVFDEYESNFNKQQLHANRLLKEVTNYLRCARALHGASKALFETLQDVYEPEWVGHDLIYVQAQNSDMIWTDFCHKLQDQSLGPLTAYTQDFPEIRKKIDKRGRKLVDFDSNRHQLENLQRSARRDEYKISRMKDQLEVAKTTYDVLNKDLYDELPAIYDQRIPNFANCIQTLFSAEGTFMYESSKIAQELEAIAEKLGKECNRGTYNAKRGSPPKSSRQVSAISPPSPTSPHSPAVWYAMSPPADLISKGPKNAETTETPPRSLSRGEEQEAVGEESQEQEGLGDGGGEEEKKEEEEEVVKESALVSETKAKEVENNQTPAEKVNGYPSLTDLKENPPPNVIPEVPPLPPPESPPLPSPSSQIPRKSKESSNQNRPSMVNQVTRGKEESGRPYEEIEFEDKKVNGTTGSPKANGEIGPSIPPGNKTNLEEIYDIPVGATTEGLPPGVLYRVRATYKYTPEDVDELGFDVGETIQVVEYDDPEEQEEGWLCGIKESTSDKGLFPANFTRPI